jgi:hypothetical protein
MANCLIKKIIHQYDKLFMSCSTLGFCSFTCIFKGIIGKAKIFVRCLIKQFYESRYLTVQFDIA